MIFPLAIALALLTGTPPPQQRAPFRLEPGEFRYLQVNVRQTPSEVDGRFDVIAGSPSVHIELLEMGEFRRFDRGRDHDTMALTPTGQSGEFRRIIDARGQYAVVVENARNAAAATVLLRVQTNLNPGADMAQILSPNRRLTVIMVSFAFFFVTVAWSGRKLVRAIRAVR